MRTAALALSVVLALPTLALASEPEDPERGWHRLVGLLQYLEADYPLAVESQSEFELTEQRAFMDEALAAASALGPAGRGFLPKLRGIQARVEKAEDPAGVSRDCGALVEELVQSSGLARSPRKVPDLEQGRELFATACAACHAADGSAQVSIATHMEPKPASFLDPEVMGGLTPYKAFNTTSFGVTGTAMPGFPTLTEDERWSVAFFLFTLRQPACDHTPPRASLHQLATTGDDGLVEEFGASELACLRRRLSEPDTEQALLAARGGISEALQLGAEGRFDGARQALVDAYLMGLEPIEPQLRARAPGLVDELERGFMSARVAAEQRSERLQDEARRLLVLVDRARSAQSEAPSFWSVFWLSFFILLREGFEATIVIAALLAVLKKLGETRHAKVVHAGWASALLAGALAFALGQKVIAGAHREVLEGVVALLAVVMLLYAALWLNSKASIRKLMGELRERVQGALTRRSVAGLFVISFTAMFRESFETALFLQGLAMDSAAGASWGAAAGLLGLLLLVGVVRRLGYALPMQTLFKASTVLLVATAVVLLGKGLHALQEAGWLPWKPFAGFQVEVLGLYGDGLSLLPQLLLALAPLAYGLVRRARGTAPVPPPRADVTGA